ncbi:MAG: hypothetical protein AAFN81_00180 [Bacteroidota bacterium]
MLHRSPAVRGYAFWALAKRDYQKLDEIILEYANDQQPVFFLQGCIGGEYPLIDLMSMIVSPNRVDLTCRKLTKEEFARLHQYRRMVSLFAQDNGLVSWPGKELENGQRKVIRFDFSFDGPCTTRPCEQYGENAVTFDFLRAVLERYPDIEIGIGVFSAAGSKYSYNKQVCQRKAEGIMHELKILGIPQEGFLTLGFGNAEMNPDYAPIEDTGPRSCWIEFVVMEKGAKKELTLVAFNEQLNTIDFAEGANVDRLEDYLLACLAQLELYKNHSPSYDLFLTIFDQARTGPKVKFEESWKDIYAPGQDWPEAKWDALSGWERVNHQLRTLATDLIHTRAVRGQAGEAAEEAHYEWDSEGGVRFYNGTTPKSILTYAATRFVGAYPPAAYQVGEVGWDDFVNPLWIGIIYE